MKISISGKYCIYEEIVDQYKQQIKLGVLKDGDRLPSCRTLAVDLGINPNTVARSYKVLEHDGYIRTIEKKGVYVDYTATSDVAEQKKREEIKKQLEVIYQSGIDKNTLIEIVKEVYKGRR